MLPKHVWEAGEVLLQTYHTTYLSKYVQGHSMLQNEGAVKTADMGERPPGLKKSSKPWVAGTTARKDPKDWPHVILLPKSLALAMAMPLPNHVQSCMHGTANRTFLVWVVNTPGPPILCESSSWSQSIHPRACFGASSTPSFCGGMEQWPKLCWTWQSGPKSVGMVRTKTAISR